MNRFATLSTLAASAALLAFAPLAGAQARATGSTRFVEAAASTPTVPTRSSSAVDNNPALKDIKPYDAQVRDGVLTVDGMVAKVRLNYNIKDKHFLYFYVPQVGTAVVALSPMPNSQAVKGAFRGNRMTITVAGHEIVLDSNTPLAAGKADAWVRIDNRANNLAPMPMMGFGNETAAPYRWPAAIAQAKTTSASTIAPPLPPSILPRTETSVTTVVKADRAGDE